MDVGVGGAEYLESPKSWQCLCFLFLYLPATRASSTHPHVCSLNHRLKLTWTVAVRKHKRMEQKKVQNEKLIKNMQVDRSLLIHGHIHSSQPIRLTLLFFRVE